MAHSLGGFLDFAHGEANAILLPHVLDFNYEASSERYVQISKAMGLQDPDKGSFITAVTQLVKAAGIQRSLGAMGLQVGDIPELARKAMLDACMVTNPRRPTQQDIEAIYERAC
jgi:alcohol dehydrogenase class IV